MEVQNKWAKDPRCVLLMHMNGENDGTVFLDESPSPKTITRYGDTKTSTTKKRFGNTSAFFDGTSDYITCGTSAWGTNDLTISVWFYPTAYAGYILDSITNSLRGFIYLQDATHVRFGPDSGFLTFTVSTIDLNAWHNIVITRKSGSVTMCIDGVSYTPQTLTTNFTDTGLTVGTYNLHNAYFFNGYLDELAVWIGVAIPIEDLYPARAPLYDYAIAEWEGQ